VSVPTWYLEIAYALLEQRGALRDEAWRNRRMGDESQCMRRVRAQIHAAMDLQQYVRRNEPLDGESCAEYLRRMKRVSVEWELPAIVREPVGEHAFSEAMARFFETGGLRQTG
jgi:hypothetical protein